MANVIGLSDEHEANLRKLAEYLLSGELKAEFDMDQFSTEGIGGTTCGTAGCAVGHAAFLFPKGACESWYLFSARFFDISWMDSEWEWCFSELWQRHDNTPEGAAKRIEWVLDNGVPDDMRRQMAGKAPLCY